MESNNIPENIPEFKALIERYESITLNEVKKNWTGFVTSTAILLTGFGNIMTCTLCISCEHVCNRCVYGESNGCIRLLRESYEKISNSKTPQELLNGYRNRAKALRLFAKDKNINIE